jgi:hypothetical protein
MRETDLRSAEPVRSYLNALIATRSRSIERASTPLSLLLFGPAVMPITHVGSWVHMLIVSSFAMAAEVVGPFRS